MHSINIVGFPGGSEVKNLPPMHETQETWVYSCWKIPWTEDSGGLQFMRLQRAGHN